MDPARPAALTYAACLTAVAAVSPAAAGAVSAAGAARAWSPNDDPSRIAPEEVHR